jgi:predicted amidohydrolase
MNRLTLALAQIDLALGDPTRNLDTARAQIAEAKARGADIVVLPELWRSAYDLEHAAAHASPLDQGTFATIANLARENQIAIVGSLLEARDGKFYNTATFHDGSGNRLGTYRKLHLVPMLDEDKFLAGGDDAPVFDAAFGKCALAVCYDLRFPELWRHYALAGARLVFIPAEWPHKRIAHWRTLLPARAIENQIFIAGCNRVGASKGETFGGNSLIVNPWGEILAHGDARDALLIAQIDLDLVDEVRARVPVFRDRRAEVYAKWM